MGAPGSRGPLASVEPDAARAAAREILDGSKYQQPDLPRPFKGVLEWLADRLRPVLEALETVFGPVIDAFLGLPGGRFILAAVVLALVGLVVVWLARRRSRSAVSSTGRHGLVDPAADPEALDREADAAAAAGDFALAVRRRYESGLLRLARADRLVLRPDTTPSSAAAHVDDPAMDELTTDFEEVVYGDREATAGDADRARDLWAGLVRSGVHR